MSTIKVDTVQSSAGVIKPLPQVTCQVNQLSTQNIVGSVGVSSITDTGTGTTTASFSSAFMAGQCTQRHKSISSVGPAPQPELMSNTP